MKQEYEYIRWFEGLDMKDVSEFGGKNASLGEMIQNLKAQGVKVPEGFATTSSAYREFLEANSLTDRIREFLAEWEDGRKPLEKVGASIRRLFSRSEIPGEIADSIVQAYRELCRRYDAEDIDIAARSSATAEDLPESSFAGQQETFLNISGEAEVLESVRKCYASLFTDRAMAYRQEHGFDHMDVALSVGIQKMVRSDRAGAGVMFSIDTESGFPDLAVINAAWGLGEMVVQGSVTPDEYRVFKPLLGRDGLEPIIEKSLGTKERKLVYASGGTKPTKTVETSKDEKRSFVLNTEEILKLAHWAVLIEKHYEKPMDMEWAKDGETGDLFIVQARPETVQSRKEDATLRTYTLQERGQRILEGISIGNAIASGEVCRLKDAGDIGEFIDGSILVTEMTDPDWVPIMKKAAGIVTDHGGRTCHAAIVSRELGIPAIVGTGKATELIDSGQEITISCAEGDEGYVYQGRLKFEVEQVSFEDIPETRTRVMMNIASPAAALRWWRLPCDGIGLARMEFIVNNIIKIHPMALIHFDDLQDQQVQKQIDELTRGYSDKRFYFIENLARGIGKIAASQFPNPVIVRMSDFKTNEYADLIGGRQFEPRMEWI